MEASGIQRSLQDLGLVNDEHDPMVGVYEVTCNGFDYTCARHCEFAIGKGGVYGVSEVGSTIKIL